jgi:hypothetical protein
MFVRLKEQNLLPSIKRLYKRTFVKKKREKRTEEVNIIVSFQSIFMTRSSTE